MVSSSPARADDVSDRLAANGDRVSHLVLYKSGANETPTGMPSCSCQPLYVAESELSTRERKRAAEQVRDELRALVMLAPTKMPKLAPATTLAATTPGGRAGVWVGNTFIKRFYAFPVPTAIGEGTFHIKDWRPVAQGSAVVSIGTSDETDREYAPSDGFVASDLPNSIWDDADVCSPAEPRPTQPPVSGVAVTWYEVHAAGHASGDCYDHGRTPFITGTNVMAAYFPIQYGPPEAASNGALEFVKYDFAAARKYGHLTWAAYRELIMNELLGNSGRYPLLRQWLDKVLGGASPDPTAGPPETVDVADRFRPILRFDSSEVWRPLNIERFLDETFDDEQETTRHQFCPDIAIPGNCVDWPAGLSAPTSFLSTTFPFLGPEDGSGRYIDIHGAGDDPEHFTSPRLGEPGCAHDGLNDCDKGPNTALYYHASGPYPEANYKFLDYWAFYRFNKFGPVHDHEADWENVAVAVPNQASPQTFAWAALSAHGPIYRYLRDALECDYGQPLDASCGSEGSARGKRVNVYVANGSHANYPKRCDAALFGAPTCKQPTGLAPPEKGHDGTRPWGDNDPASAILELPAWARLNLHWGILDGETHVANPGRQPYFDRPFATQCSPLHAGDSGYCSQESPMRAAAGEPDPCAAWNGPGVAVAVCDPEQLTAALAAGTLGVEAGPDVKVSGDISGTFASTGGLAQIPGGELAPGDTVAVDAGLSAESQVLVRFRDVKLTRRARFAAKDLPNRRARLRFKRAAGGTVELTRPDGKRIKPAEVRTVE